MNGSCSPFHKYLQEIRSPGIEPGTIWLLHESTVRCSTNWAMTCLRTYSLCIRSVCYIATDDIDLAHFNRCQSPGRRNWTSACLHAPWVEVMSKHQPDSPRHWMTCFQCLIACNWDCVLQPTAPLGFPICKTMVNCICFETSLKSDKALETGLEPAISSLGGRRLIH